MISNIKVIEKKGAIPGNTVLILAGVHGNELCGIKAFENIIPTIKVEKGTIIFCYANIEAIRQNKRFIETNLNRCFLDKQPEIIKNTIEGRTAREIMQIMKKADILLDIHASNSPESTPFTISEPESWQYAKIIPFNKITYNWDEYEKGATDAYMHEKGKKGIGIECGYINNPKGQEIAEKAVINILIKARNITGYLPEEDDKKEVYKIIGIHINKNSSFKKTREFADFEYAQEDVMVGYEGTTPIYAEKGVHLLFVRDREQTGQECFLWARREE